MLAIALIIFGVVAIGSGIWMLGQENSSTIDQKSLENAIAAAIKDSNFTSKEENLIRDTALQEGKDPEPIIKKIKEDLKASIDEPETELIDVNVKAGLDFEKFIVMKFNKDYFVIKQWAGDKYVEGRYAETTLDPDLQLELKLGNKRFPVAVECKWRSNVKGDFIRFANDGQLERYQAFETRTKMPTFIALGVGGIPSSPDALYIIPVSAFKKPIQHMANISKYWKPMDNDFFFDQEKGELR
ncbi:hypothetical protein Belba_0498 [Belliella baltica DSM 15883]|uniref:Uncharacterized protein n=1 Tax=Belliella baltica (strain DSM 15883 / CIP 108006 / LMG 21964 / BA134) TaxID=866536 RepID=I3Z1N8_BELBD|nr:hypothetical protein [Belliella baltica]AFL83156.1 hypothetical protein Belba_0498 [Belliella baltica DSM 15883]